MAWVRAETKESVVLNLVSEIFEFNDVKMFKICQFNFSEFNLYGGGENFLLKVVFLSN